VNGTEVEAPGARSVNGFVAASAVKPGGSATPTVPDLGWADRLVTVIGTSRAPPEGSVSTGGTAPRSHGTSTRSAQASNSATCGSGCCATCTGGATSTCRAV